tara:strand:+ start:516 stop:803 length:288 start_codon:yes stop_codon:yes gene_type:complete
LSSCSAGCWFIWCCGAAAGMVAGFWASWVAVILAAADTVVDRAAILGVVMGTGRAIPTITMMSRAKRDPRIMRKLILLIRGLKIQANNASETIDD